ncbi:hypothetical protein F4859DRAFT_5542 [Xylaria cf. heliscus]|nr:hypothetical protein F4859DRAFT_5542 [Xylaria cf. heliscus]
MSEKPPFRAVVVGAGLVGLTAAHMLAKTDVDFVVLEQHDGLLPEIGSLLSLLPPTFRVLDQLGLLEAVEPVLTRVAGGVFMSAATARVYREEALGQLVETNHGHGISIVHRPDYVKALYDSLPEEAKARIHVGKRVMRIDVDADGVAVHCADGTVERGSVVIGADGVHSRTRQIMQSLSGARARGQGQPAAADGTEQLSPFVTTYRMLFGNLPALPDLPAGTNYECAGDGVSTQIMTGDSRAWFAVYEKLAAPTSQRRRWTEDDKKEMLERWGALHAAPGYTVADAYARRRTGTSTGGGGGDDDVGLVSLEEGLLRDPWWWRRVVLVGDAVRKLEPHAGLGYNAGVADLVVLVNALRKLLSYQSAPRTGDLEVLFAAYQARRMEDAPVVVAMSERRARMCAWLGVKDWLLATLVVPLFPLGAYSVAHILGPVIARAPVLDWLDEKRLPARAVPYLYHPKTGTREKLVYKTPGPAEGSGLSLFTGAVVVAALATVGLRFYRRL